MTVIDVPEDLSGLDAALEAVPNRPGVFLLWPKEGDPYLARTALLRRRLLRLLKERAKPSRLLNLRHTVRRIEYWLSGSTLESSIRMYELARAHFPKTYRDILKLRLPPYVKVVLANAFPRSHVTTNLSRSGGRWFGPFRSRSSAELFESQMLDLFQMRRCQEDLEPSPAHPGCIYGEMSMCLRPCQQVVGPEEYRHEVDRVVHFLETGGSSLIESVEKTRDRCSEEMMFEEAARQHKRLEKIQEVLKLRDELARDLDHLHGVAITPSLEAQSVRLWFMRAGYWQQPREFSFEVADGKPVSLDRKLRETLTAVEGSTLTTREREEYLALLARWYYSSWRDGEWLFFDRFEDLPYRKLVHAISRAAKMVG
jgi:excinuclease UvrABC nuclease subunit